MTGRSIEDRKTDEHKIGEHKTGATIGQIISALNDRNVLEALRLLEPATESSGPPAPDRQDAPRRVKCVGCGE